MQISHSVALLSFLQNLFWFSSQKKNVWVQLHQGKKKHLSQCRGWHDCKADFFCTLKACAWGRKVQSLLLPYWSWADPEREISFLLQMNQLFGLDSYVNQTPARSLFSIGFGKVKKMKKKSDTAEAPGARCRWSANTLCDLQLQVHFYNIIPLCGFICSTEQMSSENCLWMVYSW